jgi:flavin reductase
MSSNAEVSAGSVASRPNLSLRHCLGHFATGVTIVTYEAGEGPRGITVNSFTSVSLDPPLVLVCLDKRSKAALKVPARAFGVNVLHAQQQQLAWHFAGRPGEGYEPSWQDERAAPLLQDSLAWLVCEPWSHHEAGDHVIVLGRVLDYGANPHRALCFFRGQFVELPAPPALRPSP